MKRRSPRAGRRAPQEKQPLRISSVGQKYFDEPIYDTPSLLEQSVQQALNPSAKPKMQILLGHERVKLRWMKPDGKGGLVPR